jgi:hypothetical protein
MKKILIICDSHGTKWGATGYAWQIKSILNESKVDILEYGGVRLTKIYEDIRNNSATLENYDSVIIGIGNPDIHPRMPKIIMNLFKEIGLKFVRDSYFSVPPTINLSYLVRVPFFLFRLIVIRFKNETYLTNKEVFKSMSHIIDYMQNKVKKVIVLPLWDVNQLVYTNQHNNNAKEINKLLEKEYTSEFFESKIFKSAEYKRYYNYDGFHFKNIFHKKLSNEIIRYLKESKK